MKGSVAIDNNIARIRLRWQFQNKQYSIYVAA